MVYGWEFVSSQLAEIAADLPPEGAVALMEFMTAATLNPWGIGHPPGGRWPRNMPTVPFGSGSQGMVTYLIQDERQMLYVTQVTWVA